VGKSGSALGQKYLKIKEYHNLTVYIRSSLVNFQKLFSISNSHFCLSMCGLRSVPKTILYPENHCLK
jgi:hypothetical protein